MDEQAQSIEKLFETKRNNEEYKRIEQAVQQAAEKNVSKWNTK